MKTGSHALDAQDLKRKRDQLRDGNRLATVALTEIPKEEWPQRRRDIAPDRVWRSKTFLVQVFPEVDGAIRMSVARTELGKDGRWKDGITWDELQRLKREAGYGQCDAVELFPADRDLVNVANMRHLWILLDAPAWKWKPQS